MLKLSGAASSLFAGLLCWGVSFASEGHSPSSLFEKHQTGILSRSRSYYDGYIFATGSADALRAESASIDRARQKARVKAQGNLASSNPVIRDDWPENIRTSGVGDRIARFFARQTGGRIKARGIQSVYDSCRETSCVSVVAAPESGIQERMELPWKDVLQNLEKDFEEENLRLHLADYLEIVPYCREDEVLAALKKMIEDRYGTAAGAVIGGEDIGEIPLLWERGKRLAAEKVPELEQDGLLQLLSLDPYDPVVLFYLAESFKAQDRHRLALLLYSRGTLWFIEPQYNRLCYEAVASNSEIAGAGIIPYERLRPKVIESFAGHPLFRQGLLALVIESMGTLPLADRDSMEDSSKLSLENTPEAISASPSANNFARLAYAFLEKGEELRALPFARQAARMNGRYAELATKLENRLLEGEILTLKEDD